MQKLSFRGSNITSDLPATSHSGKLSIPLPDGVLATSSMSRRLSRLSPIEGWKSGSRETLLLRLPKVLAVSVFKLLLMEESRRCGTSSFVSPVESVFFFVPPEMLWFLFVNMWGWSVSFNHLFLPSLSCFSISGISISFSICACIFVLFYTDAGGMSSQRSYLSIKALRHFPLYLKH